jgi:predicted nucleic acid-binding protein
VQLDLARSLRRIRPGRVSPRLARRADGDLPFAEHAARSGPPLLLDTCVYIDTLEGSLPPAAEALLRTRTLIHLSVVLGELSHNFGRLDPEHEGTRRNLAQLAGVIEDIPRHRVDATISAGVLLEAGMLCGLIFRLGGFQPGQEVAALNDATIYLHALERGYTVLTRNIREFDLLRQMMPSRQMLFYRDG